MASAKDLRKRITSVKNTQQITKAMKMVSAAKLRRAQNNILSLRPYSKELQKMIGNLSATLEDSFQNPLLEKRDSNEKALIILVTSDRGLCGALNGGAIKLAFRLMKEYSNQYKKVDLAFIGKKGFEYFKSRKSGKLYSDYFFKLDFKKCKDLSNELINLYLTKEYDRIDFVFSEFKSAISQRPEVEVFLPIAQKFTGEKHATPTIFEPNADKIIAELLPKHFATQIYRILLENIASEHAARMSAMENATKNASEMIRKLTLEYNKTRQAGITKELLEIVSGSEALKG